MKLYSVKKMFEDDDIVCIAPEGVRTKICTKCGIEKAIHDFYKRNSVCKKCYSGKSKEYYIANKESITKQCKIYRSKNISSVKANSKKYYKKNKQKYLLYSRKNKIKSYGLTQKEYEKIMSEQKECSVCGNECKLYIDHNHKTKKFRGLLCFNCNVAIGHFRDSIEIMKNAIKYLETNA